jgi:outer membrane protein insertion porin family
VEGAVRVADTILLGEARREIRAFEEHGRRPAEAADAAYAMEAYLRSEGFAHARVDFALEEERLLFRVQEGPRAYVRSITFEGARTLGKPDFEQLFAFEGAGPLGTGDPLFVLSQIEGAVEKLERTYLLRGFYRVRAEVARVDWSDDRSQADVTVSIEEGLRHVVKTVEFRGMDPVELGLAGRPYHVRLPVQAAATIRRRLLDEGRQRCSVDYHASVDDLTGEVGLLFTVDPGPVVRARAVRFEGNERTRTAFLRRRAAIREGDLVAQELLDDATSRLYRTGLFTLVRPRLGEGDDLVFELRETLARSLDFELGYGSYELVRGAVRYTDRNFLGLGRTLTTEVAGSVRGAGAELGVTDPYILGERNVLEVGTGYLFREEPSFDLQSFHASVLVRREISRAWNVRGGYSYRDERATNVKVPIDEEAEGFIRTAGLLFAVVRDTRDSAFLPSSGSQAEAAMLWSSPALGAELDFLELDLKWTGFLPLRPGTVFGIGGRFRAREILDSRTDLPIQERYFLGGATTVRGYYEDELGPTENGEPRGGLTSLEASAELRQRIRGEFYGAVFFDYGTIDTEGFSVNSPPGYSVGIGFRYYLPVGPIRFDVGYNPGRLYAADARWAFHLAIGFSF